MNGQASAGSLDLWRRLLNIASIVVPIVVALIMSALGIFGIPLLAVAVVLFVGLFVASLVVGRAVTQAMKREMIAGYSTLYDVVDFELRDARTLELLRPANIPPEQPGRRSLVAGLFRVKPGTVLAKRIDDENSR
ncbi:hypothetical protein BH10ACT7_BH10ACT7_05240 [soil metagenome]